MIAMLDLQQGIARELTPFELPAESSAGNWAANGVWSGDHFYFYVARPGHPGWLWDLSPGSDHLGEPVAVAPLSDVAFCRERLPMVKAIAAAAGNLFLYEPFGGKSDRTQSCQVTPPGGAWIVDPSTGRIVRQIASTFYFNKLVTDRGGAELYGVESGSVGSKLPSLVNINGRDGSVVKARKLNADTWTIARQRCAMHPSETFM
jgi:hypothetical protein